MNKRYLPPWLDDPTAPELPTYTTAPEDELPAAPAWFRGTRQQWQVERINLTMQAWREEREEARRKSREKDEARRRRYYVMGGLRCSYLED